MALGYNFATQYQSRQVRAADPMELIVLLYKGAIKELQLARKHLQAQQTGPRVAALNKALAIIGELKACLDFKAGGEIAVSLDRLYTYMTARLTKANMKQDEKGFEEVTKLLEILLSGWEEARLKQASASPANPESVSPSLGPDRLTISNTGTKGLRLAY